MKAITNNLLQNLDKRLTTANLKHASIGANKDCDNPLYSKNLYMLGEGVNILSLNEYQINLYNTTTDDIMTIDIETFKSDFDICLNPKLNKQIKG